MNCIWNNLLKNLNSLEESTGVFSVEEAQLFRKSQREVFYQEILNLANQRNNTILEGEYLNQNSQFKIKCLIHNQIFAISARAYKHNNQGLYCCGRQATTDSKKQNGIRDNKGRFINKD